MVASAQIPVIDIDASGGDAERRVAEALVDAAVKFGFVYIRSTAAIAADVLQRTFAISKQLFAAPAEEKESCRMQQNNRGYFGIQYETLDPKNQRVGDYKEGFNFGDFVGGKATQPIPNSIKASQEQLAKFTDLCYNLTLRINTLLGIGLDLEPPDYFTQAHLREKGPSGSTLRFLYYPPLPNTDAQQEDVRAGAHSDYGSITLLFRLKGQAGLEILPEDGKWAPVPVSPPGTEDDAAPPILVNIGDLLSYWTNGLLRSTVHRVIFPGPGRQIVDGESDTEPRYSIVYFAHPAGTTELGTVPSRKVRDFARQHPDALERQLAGNPDAKKRVLTSHEHLEMRLRATYLQLYKDGDQSQK